MEARGAAVAEEAGETEDGAVAIEDGTTVAAATNTVPTGLGTTAAGVATNKAVAAGTMVVDGKATTAGEKDMGTMAQVPAMMARQLDSWAL